MTSSIADVSPAVALSPEEQAALDAVIATLHGPGENQTAATVPGEEAGLQDAFWSVLLQGAVLSTGIQVLLAATEWHLRKEQDEATVPPTLRGQDEQPR